MLKESIEIDLISEINTTISSIIQNGLVLSGFNYSRQTIRYGIRSYVLEIILELTKIHNTAGTANKDAHEFLSKSIEIVYITINYSLDFIDSIDMFGAILV